MTVPHGMTPGTYRCVNCGKNLADSSSPIDKVKLEDWRCGQRADPVLCHNCVTNYKRSQERVWFNPLKQRVEDPLIDQTSSFLEGP